MVASQTGNNKSNKQMSRVVIKATNEKGLKDQSSSTDQCVTESLTSVV